MKTAEGRQAKYILIVGNVGNIFYSNKVKALKDFRYYVECSKAGSGRVAGEGVVLTDIQGEMLAEYIGTQYLVDYDE